GGVAAAPVDVGGIEVDAEEAALRVGAGQQRHRLAQAAAELHVGKAGLERPRLAAVQRGDVVEPRRRQLPEEMLRVEDFGDVALCPVGIHRSPKQGSGRRAAPPPYAPTGGGMVNATKPPPGSKANLRPRLRPAR